MLRFCEEKEMVKLIIKKIHKFQYNLIMLLIVKIY